jgi:predicted TIM-barrel fold metal-dependent hydrolase
MTEITTLENPALENIAHGPERRARRVDRSILPSGLTLVSADDHWEITEDIFYENVPAHLKEIAPRVWFDEIWWLTAKADEKSSVSRAMSGDVTRRFMVNSAQAGGYDRDRRRADLEVEGVGMSLNFPNFVLGYVVHPNLELREEVFKIANAAMAKESKEVEGFYGVGICRNWWDSDKAVQQVQEMSDLGLKTMMLPFSLSLPGRTVSYASPDLDRLYSALEDADMPLSLHVGEGFPPTEQEGFVGLAVQSLAVFRKPLGQMIFGGVFDRHPRLKVVFAEAGMSWVAPLLQDMEMFYDIMGDIQPVKKRPSEYWHSNCYATFINDRLGLERLLDVVGPDRVMWSADYPHAEGSLGVTQQSVQQVLSATTEANARLILGDTARKLFKLP